MPADAPGTCNDMRARIASLVVALVLCGCSALGTAPPLAVHRVIVNGAQLSYVEQGAGETVILVHGTATDYRVFDDLRRHLGEGYRVVAYSRRHHAPNAWPDDGASHVLAQHVEDLVSLIRALGVGRAHVVAVSLGGRVAAHAAVRHPEAFRTLTLSDALLAQAPTEEGRRAMEQLAPQFGSMLAHASAGDAAAAVAAYVDIASPGKGWNGMSPAWRRYYLDSARTLVLSVQDATLRPPSCEDLGTIPVPVLVISGEATPLAVRATNEGLLQCLRPGARLAEVPRAGHYWYADNPADGARILQGFFRAHRGN
jgi:pimeloyl-ACP methyl ester carboxylesterase